MTTTREYYGPHLILDCYGGDRDKLASAYEVERWLKCLTNILDMRVLTGPTVRSLMPAEVRTHEDYGVSGYTMIYESHISIHTYPHDLTAFVDIFSCREFDTAKAIGYTQDVFGFLNIMQTMIHRGKDFYTRREHRRRK